MITQKEIAEIKRMFLEVTSIDNPSGGEGEVVEWVKQIIKPLHVKAHVDEKQNVLFKIKGKGDPVLLCAHMDAVPPCKNKQPQFDGTTFKSNGETVLGADNAAGLVSILAALFYLKKHKIEHAPLEILFTTMEEIGGEGIKHFDFSQLESSEGIVADSIAAVGSIVMKTPSKYYFSVEVFGKSAHGSMAHKGVSAIKILADVLHRIPVGEIRPGTFVNIGRIEGGTAINAVPAEAKFGGNMKIFSDGEIRTDEAKRHNEVVDQIEDAIAKTKNKYPKGEVEFNHHLMRGGYSFHERDALILKIKHIMRCADIRPKCIESFGVSDANTFNAMGVRTVLIGTGVKNAHTVDETIRLGDMVKLTEIIIAFCKEYNK